MKAINRDSVRCFSDRQLKSIISKFEKWVPKREETISTLSRLANKVDNCHELLSIYKVTGGFISILGTCTAIAASFFCPPAAVFGFGIAGVGASKIAVSELIEYVVNKSNMKEAQQTIDEDTAELDRAMDTLLKEYGIWNMNKGKTLCDKDVMALERFLVPAYELYDWGNRLSQSKIQLERTLSTLKKPVLSDRAAGAVGLSLSLDYVIRRIIEVENGNISDVARAIRKRRDELKDEKDDLVDEMMWCLKDELERREKGEKERKERERESEQSN